MTIQLPRRRARTRRGGRAASLGDHADRRALELAGWRTWLEFRENQRRDQRGMLIAVEQVWIAEAERAGRRLQVASVSAGSVDDAWVQLRRIAATGTTRPQRSSTTAARSGKTLLTLASNQSP